MNALVASALRIPSPGTSGGPAGILLALGLLFLSAPPAAAQEQDSAPATDTASVRWATLVGQVVSAATGKPIDGALVSLRGSRFGAVTDSAGNFRIPRAAAGQDTVAVRYIGFEESALPLFLEPERTTRVVLLLSPTVIRLADLVVEVQREEIGPMSQFERRRRHGLGRYITEEEIERRSPRYASDMLRDVPGVRVGAATFGRASVSMSRSGQPCPPNVVLDGILVRDMHIDDIPPEDLGALEVYTGPSEVPAEYAGMGSSGCGLIVVWTRRGGRQ